MKKVLLLLLIAALLNGCKEKKSEIPAIDPAFISYVSGFTSGVVPAGSSIAVTLLSDIPESVREKSLETKLLEIRPSVKGSISWVDSRTLEFSPEGSLDPGTLYNCKFHLDRVMEVPEGLEVLEFQFQTIQQSIFVEMKGLSSLDDDNLEWQQLSGTLKTADYADV